MLVDEDSPPVTTPCDFLITVRTGEGLAPALSALEETEYPELLFTELDVRPQWLLKSIEDFLQHGPYYSCLNKVVDLFLEQERGLSYPVRVSEPCSFKSSLY